MTISENERKVLARAARIMEREIRYGDVLSSPAKVRDFLKLRFAGLEHEVFGMLVLDNRHRVIEYVELFRGTIDGAACYPREVVKEVLRLNGAAVIFSHNHPSQVPVESDADIAITRKLKDALMLYDVRVLDHIICAGVNANSLAERGLL